MNRIVPVIVSSFFVAVSVAASPALSDSSGQRSIRCDTQASCPIVYDHLATQETDPFLFTRGSRNRDAETRQVKRFHSVTDCLIASERRAEKPDLRKINWQKMTDYSVLEVCMFRIFASYGSPEKAKLWFEAQGLEDVIIDTYSTPTDVITRVRVYNRPRETKFMFPKACFPQ